MSDYRGTQWPPPGTSITVDGAPTAQVATDPLDEVEQLLPRCSLHGSIPARFGSCDGCGTYVEALSALARARQEREGLREDRERWLWWKNNLHRARILYGGNAATDERRCTVAAGEDYYTGVTLNDAIDSARRAAFTPPAGRDGHG